MNISLLVNGDKCQLEAGSNLEQLIVKLGFAEKKIAVELNEQIIPKRLYRETLLQENDSLEVVQAIGGG
jgi:sulfur carrier protein